MQSSGNKPLFHQDERWYILTSFDKETGAMGIKLQEENGDIIYP
jgi:hypothetical protein